MMGKQLTFSLACAAVMSALLPGAAGYLSARMEAIEAAELRLQTMEIRLQRGSTQQVRPVSFPRPCEMASPLPTEPPAAAAFVPAPEFKVKKRLSPGRD
ncbi:hypothetical protein [Nonomuraea sp. NPDC050310]|uniref:hypothetical protein n=1 Tax=unclassified Nonomuraea TaxID=2593643 RepID=UPI0033EB74A0